MCRFTAILVYITPVIQSGDHRNMKINYGSPFWTLGKEFFSKSDQICTGKHRQAYSGIVFF